MKRKNMTATTAAASNNIARERATTKAHYRNRSKTAIA